MPEGLNVEVAHKLSEQEESERRKHRWEEIAEVIEVPSSRWLRLRLRGRLQATRVGVAGHCSEESTSVS
jgi:hypothetical protein